MSDIKLLGRPMPPMLRGNNEGAVTGCVGGSNCNIMRGGYHAAAKNDGAVLASPRAGYMGVEQGRNCGTINPLNQGASTQHGGSCGCSGETAAYGFTGGADAGVLRGSYAPVGAVSTCPPTKGGKRKGRKSRKHKGKKSHKKTQRKGGRSCKGGMSCKGGKRKERKSRKQNRRSKKHSSQKKRTMRRRKHMRGGYQQLGTNRPFTPGHSLGGNLAPRDSALASPPPHSRIMHTGPDNYNHFKGTGSPSPVLDKDVSGK